MFCYEKPPMQGVIANKKTIDSQANLMVMKYLIFVRKPGIQARWRRGILVSVEFVSVADSADLHRLIHHTGHALHKG